MNGVFANNTQVLQFIINISIAVQRDWGSILANGILLFLDFFFNFSTFLTFPHSARQTYKCS